MNKFRFTLAVVVAAVVSACKVDEDDTTICHYPDDGGEYEVLTVGERELEEHFFEHGDLCYDGGDETCYEPDFDGWEEGDEFCPS